VANRKTRGIARRFWISGWLPPGVALGWLAVLSAFVHGGGMLLATWAATSALGLSIGIAVLVLQRRATSSSERRTDAQPSPASVEKTEPARPAVDAEQATTSPADDTDPSPPAGSAQTMAQHGPLEPGPKASLPEAGASVPAAAPAATEFAIALGMHVLTTAEVASVLRVDAREIARAISDGELPGNWIGGDWRVDLGALRHWLQGRYQAPSALSGPATSALFGDEQT
jgi:excisionase family DNA binding protein